MRFLIAIFLLLSVSFFAKAQNLVLNPSFEDTIYCPNGMEQIYACQGWTNWGDTISTPDYLNSCSNIANPLNSAFYQPPHTGNGYAAFATYGQNNYREFIGTSLLQPLSPGVKYYISFYVTRSNYQNIVSASNNFGVTLTMNSHSTQNPILISNAPTFNFNQVVSDTLDWVFISGNFIADSSYSYIGVGNFYDNVNTDTVLSTQFSIGAYYAIDDICISSDSLYCNSVLSNLEIANNELSVYPNPTENFIQVKGVPREIEYNLYDALGRRVNSSTILPAASIIDLSNLAKGIYLLQLKLPSGYVTKTILRE